MRLARSRATVWFLAGFVAATGCAGASRAKPKGDGFAGEAEAAFEGVSVVIPGWCASAGKAVGVAPDGVAKLRVRTSRVGEDERRFEQVLWLRVASVGGGTLEVVVETEPRPVEVRLPDTLHRERFEWCRVAPTLLPTLSNDRSVDLRWLGESELRVDQWAWLGEGEEPEASAGPGVWRSADGSLEVRAGAGAAVADPEWALLVVREQRDVVASLFGTRLARPLVVIALPAREWPEAASGAFQNGCAIFLRDDELHLPWRSYAHEIAHLFEEERQVELPWFLSEGIACAIGLEVEQRVLGEYGPVADKKAELARLLQEGDALHRPGSADPNPAFTTAFDPPDPTRRASALAWSTALVTAAAAAAAPAGPPFWRRLHESLSATPLSGGGTSHPVISAGGFRAPEGRRQIGLDEACAVLEAATGRSLAELFRQTGLIQQARPEPAAR